MCIRRERRRRLGKFLFCMLMVLSIVSVASNVLAEEPQKVVLALYGSRPDLPANVLVDEIIRSTLERELGSHLDFYAEFLDATRWPEDETQSAVRDFLRRRYARKKLSAIIAVARPAIKFVRLYGNELFPGVPIVAYGDSDALRDWEPGRPITGALGKVDLRGTVQLMLGLQPNTREILVISGASPSDQWLQSLARGQLEELEKQVKFTYLNGIPVEDLVRTVARSRDGTAILFLSMYQDSRGTQLLNDEALSRIAKAAHVPVYNQGAIHVGLGIVGGVVFDPESLGRETAQLTLRILRGERIQDLPVQESKSAVPMVDWRQMQRWGLSEKRLPAGTVVRFREPSVWQTYKWYIIGAISLIVIEALLLLALMWQRARRRRAENELGITYDRLRMAVEAGRFVGWDLDIKRATNRWFGNLEAMFGISSEEYFAQTGEFFSRVHPDDRDAVARAIDSARHNRQPYIAEFRVTSNNGDVRWVIAKGKFYYASNGEPERMLGLAVDVTEHYRTQELLRESEERFRLVANTAPVMIWMAGPDKLFTYFNNPWLDFTGRPLEVELGNGWADGVHPEDSNVCLQTYSDAFNRREPFNMIYRLRRKDGEYRWVFSIGVPRFNSDSSFLGYIGSCIDITERKLAEEALSTVSRRLVQAQEQERIRIARELHDDINQRLAMAQIDIEGLCFNSPHSLGELKERLEGVRARLSDTSSEVQAISHRLHSSKLEYLGLVAASKSFCREMAERQKMSIEFQADGVPPEVPQDVSLALFRVLQESLQNVTKHSGAQHVDVQLRGISGEVQLTVRDDGKGFDVNATIHSQGLGLISMRERVNLIKGMIAIESKPIGGTQITVRVPILATDAVRQATSGAA